MKPVLFSATWAPGVSDEMIVEGRKKLEAMGIQEMSTLVRGECGSTLHFVAFEEDLPDVLSVVNSPEGGSVSTTDYVGDFCPGTSYSPKHDEAFDPERFEVKDLEEAELWTRRAYDNDPPSFHVFYCDRGEDVFRFFRSFRYEENVERCIDSTRPNVKSLVILTSEEVADLLDELQEVPSSGMVPC